MMLVKLQTIEFDHTTLSASNDALSIRVNRATTAGPWRAGAGSSAAAFALAPTLGQTLTVSATLTFDLATTPLPGTMIIRARPADGTTSVLGSVAATTVNVPAGPMTTLTVSLPLIDVSIWADGVGEYDVSWVWQVQVSPSDQWIDFDYSDHAIFVTLDVPTAPWAQLADTPHQALWPWREVLEYACEWAQGITITSTLEHAAGVVANRIERALFDLGTRPDMPVTYGGPTYAPINDQGVLIFFLTDFLALLSGAPLPDTSRQLDCADCSAALLTFANALGCGLALHRVQQVIGGIGIHTNPIILIGSSQPHRHFFSQHDVTILGGQADASSRVFDSCLMVDRDSNPSISRPGNFGLAHGSGRGDLIGGKRNLKWMQRLVKRSEWPICGGVPLSPPCLDQCVDPQIPSAAVVTLWQLHRHNIDVAAPPIVLDAPPAGIGGEPPAVQLFYVYQREDGPRRFAVLSRLVTASVEYFYAGRGQGGDQRLSVSIAAARSQRDARDALAWLLTQSDVPPDVIRAKGRAVGDVSFTSGAHTAYFVRGNIVVRVRSIGRRPAPLLPAMKAADAAVRLVSMPPSMPFRAGAKSPPLTGRTRSPQPAPADRGNRRPPSTPAARTRR